MRNPAYTNLILFKNDLVLMQLRDDKPEILFPNMWAIPGGKIEENELSRDCIIREIREETGYILKEATFCFSIIYDFLDDKPTVDFYRAEYDKKQIIRCYEGQKMEFIPLSKIRKLKCFPKHTKQIQKAYKIFLASK